MIPLPLLRLLRLLRLVCHTSRLVPLDIPLTPHAGPPPPHAAALQQDDNDRILALALRKPVASPVENDTMTVSFNTGPNLWQLDYTVSCYDRNDAVPTTDCGAVAAAGLVPIDAVAGMLPKNASRVDVEVSVQGKPEVDCLVTVEGGPIGVASKCQYAKGSGCTSADNTNGFELNANDVTVECASAQAGETGEVCFGGAYPVTFTKVNGTELYAIAGNATRWGELPTVCTTGVTDMSNLFKNKGAFNESIGSWDTSAVTNMESMYVLTSTDCSSRALPP